MASWRVDEPIRVSVCCITYKQEQYIVQAVDSFLMQKTTFPFEIIIGEDCGGDGTLTILAEYQKRYPNLIKVITSENNVGANANILRVFNAAKGDYIAICEGDDYWVDEVKLQKQYDNLILEKNINICFTASQKLASNGTINRYAYHNKHKKIFEFSSVVRGGGGFMPTASIMVKSEIVNKMPDWFVSAPIGDFYIQILGALGYGALYLPDVTCVYRLNAVGSWTNSKFKDSSSKIINDAKIHDRCIRKLEQLSDCRYNNDYNYAIAMFYYGAASLLTKNKDYQHACEMIKLSWGIYKMMSFKQIILYLFKNNLFFIRGH
uniref:Putative glycosyltransferase n=1 Tax=Aeromonas hydrophila TaxID=644 RepID=A0A346ACJ9_AERHY|nr:putative glycosyltransferase [Aeromonas hydrophila]